MNTKTKLSSDDATWIYKVGFPVLVTLVALVGTIVGSFNWRGDLWFLVIFWPVMAAWMFWFSNRLKWVSIDDHALYVAGLREQIEIPFSEVVLVKSSSMQRPKTIILLLRSTSRFGDKIVFVPEQRSFESLRSGHPLEEQLRTFFDTKRLDSLSKQR